MQKDILAKLLATENITVIHENAPTASFNVKDRVLTLPLWEELTGDNYDHFIGHEVGHALFTPEEGWHDAVCDRGQGYKSFLNVIEDARIEKLIQRRYPGLRRNFINSYKKLFADGFFGADLSEVNKMSLIDRINTYFKLGASFGVRIEKEEMPWIKEIEACETWEQVVDITDRLFEDEKEKIEEQKQNEESYSEPNGEFGEEDEDEGESPLDFESEEGEDEDLADDTDGKGSITSEDDTGEETEEQDEFDELLGEQDEYDESSEFSEDPISKTEEALHNNIRKEFNEVGSSRVFNLKLNTNKIDSLIVDYKSVAEYGENIDLYLPQGIKKVSLASLGTKEWKKFQLENKKTVNYMVKEFEMKKKASEYARTTLSKTGVIDPVKMNNYKFSDDIFRKMAVTPEGKNHGMILYLDWSGSMHSHLKSTVDQLLNLVMFCRQVNIPYRVYAFTDRFLRKDYAEVTQAVNNVDVNTLQYKEGFRLLEFFNNRMSRREFSEMAQTLLAIVKAYSGRVAYPLPYEFNLGGTPLDDAIMAGVQISKEFKRSNRLDIVNSVFLTDGDSHPIECKIGGYWGDDYYDNASLWHLLMRNNVIVKFIDPETKRQYRVSKRQTTKQLLRLFQDHTGSNAIGYRIVTLNKRNLNGEFRDVLGIDGVTRLHEELKANKFTTIPDFGYTEFFALAGGKHLETSNGQIEVADDAKVGQIRTAFKKANSKRKASRVLLSQFMDLVA